MDTTCRDEERRSLVSQHTNAQGRQDVYGLDYLDVSDDERTLTVYFLGKAPPRLREEHKKLEGYVRVEGGQRIRDLKVLKVRVHQDPNPERDDYMEVQVDRPGDFTTYRLHLVNVPDVDPRLASLDFTFKVDCPSDLDCAAEPPCPPRQFDEPDINYLAKDYASFRQLILDRLALLMPDWKERHVPDLGIALVEVLAYTGDYLSYYQDAIATEAYLDTARRRISVRRHTRLVDYVMHEGYNARAWVYVRVGKDMPLDPQQVEFLAGLKGLVQDNQAFVPLETVQGFAAGTYEVFERPLANRAQAIPLYEAHNEIRFYTWGDRECCLPRGTTRATLLDEWEKESSPVQQSPASTPRQYDAGKEQQSPSGQPDKPQRRRCLNLHVGDFLLFEEIAGPKTGVLNDADVKHRHVVRLTRVEPREDRLILTDDGLPTPVLEIEWLRQDALPFPLCISSIGDAPDCKYIDPVSVARGNLILADQGETVEQDLGSVEGVETGAECDCEGHPADVELDAGLFDPPLAQAPLVFADPLPARSPASTLLQQNAQHAMPEIRLQSQLENQTAVQWTPRADLLGSRADDAAFVVEMDDERVAHLRFGDGDLGLQPPANAQFRAQYRVARSTLTQFGQGAISHLTTRQGILADIVEVRNPLAAQGPLAPQSLKEAKLLAPGEFKRVIERAITADDYARIAEREEKVQIQRASANMAWTGSWYEADVAIDPFDSEDPGYALLDRTEDILAQYRRIGHDLRVQRAVYVPLALSLQVCVDPDYVRGYVEGELQEVFSNRELAGGRLGFFHPDNLTFGQSVYLSQLVAAAQAVTGVQSVQVVALHRLFEAPNHELEQGYLPLGPNEIAQLDNDPSFPEHGQLTLDIRGGR